LFPSATDPVEPIKIALNADELGFDYLRMPDHATWALPQFYVPDIWTMLTAVGVLTKHLTVCAAVSDPYRRPPLVLAQSVATLDRLTGGRAALGIGAGEAMNLAPFGLKRTRPYETLKEAIVVIKKLWESSPSKPADFDGEVYKLDKAFIQFGPVQQPHPPIYVGALGPRTRRLTGELGDGWFGWVEDPQTFREHMLDLTEGAKSVGRDVGEIDSVASVGSVVSEDHERAFKSLEMTAKVDVALERNYLKRYGYDLGLDEDVLITKILPTGKDNWEMLNRAALRVPDKVVDDVMVMGTVDECIAKLEKFIRSGATSISIYTLGEGANDTYAQYSKRIIPYLKETYGNN
jgi:phthiodiolone/phenolphthiodiolone dimycocerosates ketoreductase